MTDEAAAPADAPAPAPAAASPGTLMRRAREAQGMHIAVLAASLKVPPKRLEALEQDRWDDLPDPAFTRALAQSVCRALKQDPAPVLALLPRADGTRLEQVAGGINTPFRERPGAVEPGVASLASRPVTWVVVLLVLGALAVLFWPSQVGIDQVPVGARQDVPAASPAVALPAAEPGSEPLPQGPDAAAAPASAEAPAADAPGADASGADAPAGAPDLPAAAAQDPSAVAAPVVLRASGSSWIEATDAAGRVLVSRTLQAGETLPLDATLPVRLTVGNADHTEVLLRGQPVDLAPHRRGNIARLELQ